MARALKDFGYRDYVHQARMAGDIERMSPRVMKMYLRYRLHLVEAQIELLADKMGVDARQPVCPWLLTNEPIDGVLWDSWSNLRYLISRRDDMRRTLAKL